jgi:hypothetical protein
MTDGKQLTLSINTLGLCDNYLTEIQNLADIVAFIYGVHGSATPDTYSSPLGFLNVEPATSRKLTFEQAKEKSAEWLVASFLADGVNITGNLLDETGTVCALLCLFSATKHAKGAEVNRILIDEARIFNRLGFPDKFLELRKKYGVGTSLESHFLSLNKARNCLVHRKGVVSRREADSNGELVVTWRTWEMVAKAVGGGPEIVLTKPVKLESESEIFVRVVDKSRSFNIGQKISFGRDELQQSIFTLFMLARDLVTSVDEYGKKIGAM